MATRRPLRRDARGQAVTETVLHTWILLVFIAAIYQLFLVNQTVYSSVAAVHQKIFARAFERNCYEAEDRCRYTTDRAGSELGARVIWSTQEVPEVVVPVVGMFREAMPPDLRLWSNARSFDDDCPGLPCKRTKLGSGTYEPPFTTLFHATGQFFDPDYWGFFLDNAVGILFSFL